MNTRQVTDSFIGVLRDGGLTVGDGVADTDPPCVVVWPLSAEWDGAVGAGSLWSELDATVQATCIGSSREQAEWLADRVHDLTLAADEGWRARPLPRPNVVRDDDTARPPLFYAYARFALHTWT